ncbi:hypothetical protein PR048_005024 [Dryococelus australis]|uniref:CCHC-type domain-containing protein n=1 Tax=Dryococelus australis TaxID=614101 RepID=A0ABQ9I715_9NEOP|nr:hypothetical protein PR048_005024 [Dryococelus australis]
MADTYKPSAIDLMGNVTSGKSEKAFDLKVAILLNLVGEDVVEVFNTFNLSDAERQDYNKVLAAFEQYVGAWKMYLMNVSCYIHGSNRRVNHFSIWRPDRQHIERLCFYGCTGQNITEGNVAYPRLTLEKACEIAKLAEISNQHFQGLVSSDPQISASSSDTVNVSALNHQTKYNRMEKSAHMGKPTTQLKSSKCLQCNYIHSKNKCPAFGKTCFQCGKLNHFATMCRTSSNVKVVKVAKVACQARQ